MKNMTTIMIVEDETVVAMALEDTITGMGYRVCAIAASGSRALELAESEKPDLVIMDIKIKGSMDGIHIAEKLKKNQIPVIFLTAFSDQTIIERAKPVEPLGYILKPYKTRELKTVLDLAVYKAKMEKKLQQLNQELEHQVTQRTQILLDEIQLRKQIENALHLKSVHLQQANKALTSALENREAEQRAMETAFYSKLEKYVLPHIDLLINAQGAGIETATILPGIKTILTSLTAPSSEKRFARYRHLSHQEIKIADLIRFGKSTKEIAMLLNIAPSSVSTYRHHIRKKLGLIKSKTNLASFLKSLE